MQNTLTIQVEAIIDRLKEAKHTVTFAESCTGGKLAATLTSVPGASTVFNGSVVSYGNDIKRKWLGVTQDVLDTYGAVSKQCVSQMLKGIVKMTDAQYALAVSGIAGPEGGTPLKPVGTVYIGLRTPQKESIYHCCFKGDRQSIQNASVVFAYEKLAAALGL